MRAQSDISRTTLGTGLFAGRMHFAAGIFVLGRMVKRVTTKGKNEMGYVNSSPNWCRRMSARLLQGTAMVAIAALAASTAHAQSNNTAASANSGTEQLTVETVTVTGTSIHDAEPVGQNLVTIGRDAIAKTGAQSVQQLLTNVTTLQGFGSSGTGGFAGSSFDGSGADAPTVHGLGASASNSTLILIDGHRLPLTGLAHSLADPNVIAPLALERVEILPDGDSAIYGSDAVAGVINFVTRKNYDGLEATAQAGIGNGYNTYNAGFVAGHSWSTGSAMVSYSYSDRSALGAADRSFSVANKTPFGGTNFNSNSCAPAEVKYAGGYYTAPYTGAAMTQSAASTCDYSAYGDIIPSEVRNNVLVSLTQSVGDRLQLSADLVYSNRLGNQRAAQSQLANITVFGAGGPAGQANPYFQGPAGASASPTGEQIFFDPNTLLGSSVTKSGAQDAFVTFGADYKIAGDWVASLGATFGQDNSIQVINNGLCAACAALALNGTTSSSGSTSPTTLGAVSTLTTQNLSSPNALVLDPWGNNTSAATKAFITGQTNSGTTQTLDDVTLKFDGTVFTLPAGPLKAAIGVEGIQYGLHQFVTRPSSTSVSNTYLANSFGRNVKSVFGEVRIPVFGEGAQLPLVQAFNVDVSARYDHYSDFGGTTNPKFAADWTVTDGLKLRASYGTSFTAPALTSHGDANGITTESGFGGSYGGPGGVALIPTAFPGEAAWQAAIGANSQCNVGGCTINQNPALNGVTITGGNSKLKPETGSSRSFGVDFDPPWIEGFHASLTYWISRFSGAITAPLASNDAITPGLYHKITLGTGPGGTVTAAQIAAATQGLLQTSPLPATAYYIFSYQQDNAYDLNAAGIDFNVQYTFATDNSGVFTAGLSGTDRVRMLESFNGGQTYVSHLNENFNTTFSALALVMRGTLDWQLDPFDASVFVNYTNPYQQKGQSVLLYPPSGVHQVGSYITVDLHLAYTLPDGRWTSGTQLFLDGSNIFDQAPPFYNNAAGFDFTDASPIGRVMYIGLSKKF
ncbi:MAG: TonB-dependent receptor [Alphaproteobacteria bacterium]|nr:TonB-dependent receptor [Alphaproteobacteria bacterium]